MAGVGDLPTEILQEIFTYLSGTELARCCQVNRQWRNCANSDVLWRPLCENKGIICEAEYTQTGLSPLDPMVDWARAYMDYVKIRFTNWATNQKSRTTIHSSYGTIACCDGDCLAFTNSSKLIFIYDISRMKPHCVQTIIPEPVDYLPVCCLEMGRGHLVARLGDAFALYAKRRHRFFLRGYFLRVDDSYVFTQGYYETQQGSAPVKHCILDGGLAIAVDSSLFMCRTLGNVDIREVSLSSRQFWAHDHFRVYVVTHEKVISGLDTNMNFEDLTVDPDSVLSVKSNRDFVIGLASSLNLYNFHIWDVTHDRSHELPTHRPFAFEIHPKRNLLVSVALDKFNFQLLLTIYNLNYNVKYEVELSREPIAQAKIYFIGRHFLYCATRSDWDLYDTFYIVDLRNMKIAYDEDIGPTNIVSVEPKHAVYNHGEDIEVHTYLGLDHPQSL